MTKELVIYRLADLLSNVEIPLFETLIPAGSSFPNPAVDFSEEQIDFNEELIYDKDATFVGRVKSDSMIDAHIVPNCRVVIDRSIVPNSGDIIVAIVCNEFMIKYYKVKNGKIWLVPANVNYTPLEINEFHEFQVWGVVTRILIKPQHLFHL